MEKDVYDRMKSMKGEVLGMDGKLKEAEVDKISELIQVSNESSFINDKNNNNWFVYRP